MLDPGRSHSTTVVTAMPVQPKTAIYLEVGTKRVFAGALEWPGWCRSGRDEGAALKTLVTYGARYKGALGRAARGLMVPASVDGFDIVERLGGNATTDFGAPGVAPESDARSLSDTELDRMTKLLRACWAAFDSAAEGAVGAVLRTGPRGGGRKLDAMVAHVLEADRAYLGGIGGSARKEGDADLAAEMAHVRAAILDAIAARARGERPVISSRRKAPIWSPRYTVRRSAWHALDHAWEIQDRAH